MFMYGIYLKGLPQDLLSFFPLFFLFFFGGGGVHDITITCFWHKNKKRARSCAQSIRGGTGFEFGGGGDGAIFKALIDI